MASDMIRISLRLPCCAKVVPGLRQGSQRRGRWETCWLECWRSGERTDSPCAIEFVEAAIANRGRLLAGEVSGQTERSRSMHRQAEEPRSRILQQSGPCPRGKEQQSRAVPADSKISKPTRTAT